MPTCQHCKTEWTWTETFKKSFALGIGMTCPHCGEKQYVTARFRKRSTIVPFIISGLIMFGNIFLGPSYIAVLLLLLLLVSFFLIYPFFIELSNEEEALF